MPEFPSLESLGNRIMICGPSNAGKSTLAAALGDRLGLPAVHLDQLYHLPGTDWVARPREEFIALHDAAISADGWVMDGNYAGRFPARLERATGIILLGGNRWANLLRYFRRTLFQRGRVGSLVGGRDSLKWSMIHWIMVAVPAKRRQYRALFPTTGLPYIELRNLAALNRLYAEWGLTRG